MDDINNKTLKDYLAGKATDREMERLAEWLACSEENRRELFGLEAAYHLGKPNPLATPEKIDEAEAKLFNRIGDYEAKKNRSRSFRILRYAAAVLAAVLLVGGGLYAYFRQSVETITVAALGGVKKVVLPDHSTVWLNRGASISYAEGFDGTERKVNLKGEALFHVTKNPERPFIVSSGGASAKVLGTTFNFNAKGTGDEDVISLIEGRLEVTGLAGQGKVVLHPNQKATVSRNAPTIRTENGYAPVDAVWRDNMIPFSNLQIGQIAGILEQVYGCKITVDSRLESGKTYTGVIKRNKDIRKVLDGLSYTVSFHYTISGRKITLSE
ncbi:FecR domain-containing protein [Prevotella denticola]|uniref:FecR family protein n=1 Tax=Prevotella denticola TaxID=28129 RepID=UPI001BC850E8|nr:FecR family protein [Prevotella denticola]QUI93606.1 FecR domain-containing protein [Prevotella denticola]